MNVLAAGMIILVALVGCGGITPLPQEIYIRLALAVPPSNVVQFPASAAWRVAPFRGSGVHKERALAYTRDHGKSLQQYPRIFWLDSPERLLQATLAGYLRAGANVQVTTERASNAGLEVFGIIQRFEQDLSDDQIAVDADLVIELRRQSSGRLLCTKEYRVRQSIGDASAVHVATAMSEAVTQIYAQFATDAAAALKSDVASE
ncbi:MAG: membrane integrity-associated transporter subunit PqiC [Gammaproteobacteria bacterium]|nr:membrane integrity-associated transporter subunit PqiC [Gammaproteobacteria bacterium]